MYELGVFVRLDDAVDPQTRKRLEEHMRCFATGFYGVNDEMLDVLSGEDSFWVSIIAKVAVDLGKKLFGPSFQHLGERLASSVEKRLPAKVTVSTPSPDGPAVSLTVPYKELSNLADERADTARGLVSGMTKLIDDVEVIAGQPGSIQVVFSQYNARTSQGQVISGRKQGDSFQLHLHRTNSLEDIHSYIKRPA